MFDNNTTCLSWVMLILFILTSLTFHNGAYGQSTGGVFPPTVNDGHRSWQYRATFDPENNGFAQRLHYQNAINDDVMWRILGQTRKTDDSDFDPDFIQAELFWDLSNKGDRLRKGVRFDGRHRFDDRPGLIGVNGMLEYDINEHWTTRGLILTALNIGNNAPDGIFLQTRSNIFRKVSARTNLGLELFSSYGSTADFRGNFDEQGQQAGPFIVQKFDDGWSIFGGALFGLNNSSPDANLRFWITKAL